MAVKKCPSCGKKIAAEASLCLYCSYEFPDVGRPAVEDVPPPDYDNRKPKKQNRPLWIITAAALAVVAVFAVAFAVVLPKRPQAVGDNPSETTTTTTPTQPTRDAARDQWLHTFTGRWVDEESVGKSDLENLGGHLLHIHDIVNDQVLFDLYAYSGERGEPPASVTNVLAELNDDTLHFTFRNDEHGNSGEGYMRFTDEGIQMEVTIENEEADDHSLAVNAVFRRQAIPEVSGMDIRSFRTLADVREAAGDETADAVTDPDGSTVYFFGMITAVCNADGVLTSLTVDYADVEDKTRFCYDRIDGTMNYDTVKTYFGEAVHDYIEQPTNIRVLHYTSPGTSTVTFTFHAEDNLLIRIAYFV